MSFWDRFKAPDYVPAEKPYTMKVYTEDNWEWTSYYEHDYNRWPYINAEGYAKSDARIAKMDGFEGRNGDKSTFYPARRIKRIEVFPTKKEE